MPDVLDEPCAISTDAGVVTVDCEGAIISLTPLAAHVMAQELHERAHEASAYLRSSSPRS